MSKLELTSECAGCGAPSGLCNPAWNACYCPQCALLNDEYNRVIPNLVELVRPVMEVWRAHWIGRGMKPDVLVEALESSDNLTQLLSALNEADPQSDS